MVEVICPRRIGAGCQFYLGDLGKNNTRIMEKKGKK